MQATISPERALQGRSWAIVRTKNKEVYSLYREMDEAVRICRDLNKRYGDGSYYVAHIEQPTCHIVKTWTDSDYADHWRYSCSECGYPIEVGERDVATGDPVSHANFCWNCGRKVVDQ